MPNFTLRFHKPYANSVQFTYINLQFLENIRIYPSESFYMCTAPGFSFPVRFKCPITFWPILEPSWVENFTSAFGFVHKYTLISLWNKCHIMNSFLHPQHNRNSTCSSWLRIRMRMDLMKCYATRETKTNWTAWTDYPPPRGNETTTLNCVGSIAAVSYSRRNFEKTVAFPIS